VGGGKNRRRPSRSGVKAVDLWKYRQAKNKRRGAQDKWEEGVEKQTDGTWISVPVPGGERIKSRSD
jgi:hypothetical protein